MSVRYDELVVPEAEHWDFRPTRDQLNGVLEYLFETQWLRSASDATNPGILYLDPDGVGRKVDATPPDQCLVLYLEGGPPGNYPDEWPEEQPELVPELCEDVTIIDSPAAVAVPVGMAELRLPCPNCSEDLLKHLAGDAEDTSPYPDLSSHGYHVAPVHCASCGEHLRHADMALYSDDEAVDEAPFFHFGLNLLAARSPSAGFSYADPELLQALQNICGVPFRSIGRDT